MGTPRSALSESVPSVLLAEDDSELRALLALTLRREGYRVTECRDGIELADHLGNCMLPEKLGRAVFELIISDIRMPGVTGLEALESVGSRDDFPPMVLITAFGDESTHRLAERLGAIAVLDKPLDLDELVQVAQWIAPL